MVPAGLGKAAEAMAELCVLLGLFLNIYVGIIIWYKFLQSDKNDATGLIQIIKLT